MSVKIREINPNSEFEVELVAKRMRQTLIDVLGEEKGASMYTMDWLKQRVLWHLDSKNTIAKIFLTVTPDERISGQAIARIEYSEDRNPFGYFSTIYVEPESRQQGVATSLLVCVEQWLIKMKMPKIIYNTAESNSKLIRLFREHGYVVTDAQSNMVQLTKQLKSFSADDFEGKD